MRQRPPPPAYDRPVLVVDPGVHTAVIKQLDADREGRFLVTASLDKTVRVWSAADGTLVRTIRLPAGPGDVGKAYAVAISPDGATIAAGGWTRLSPSDPEEQVYLFDRASRRLRRRVGGLPDVVPHLAFSPNGTRLAAALGSGGLRLIDPAAGRVVAADEAYGDQSYGAAFDPASGRLATTSLDGKIRLYDARDGLRLLRAVETPGGRRPYSIAFSPDGRRLAVGYADTTAVDVLDGTSSVPLFVADTAGVDNGNLVSVAWSADGETLLAAGMWHNAGGENLLRRWPEGGRGVPVDRPLSQSTIMDLRPLPGGRLAFAAAHPRLGVLGPDGRQVWSVGPSTTDFRYRQGILAVSADGGRIAFLSDRWDEAKRGWDMQPMRFSLPELRLAQAEAAEEAGLATARTTAPGLVVEGWFDSIAPTLNGAPLALNPYETARSLAVAPDGRRFVLGTEWSLRLFDQNGTALDPWPEARLAVAAALEGEHHAPGRA